MDTGHTDHEIIHALNLEKEGGENKEQAIENVVAFERNPFDREDVERWADEVF